MATQNDMNLKEKRALIHKKLEVMKKCYRERDVENFDLFYDAFFDREQLPVVIGTDNGEWFRSMERIRWLIKYDWEHWGDLSIDTWNFTIHEEENHDMVRVRGLMDFGEDRAWDIDIVMIFDRNASGYPCRLMQFKIPRNEIRPVVILNKSYSEQEKSKKEMQDLMSFCADDGLDLMRGHLAERITKMLKEQKPYLANLDVRRGMIYLEESNDGFCFALTGFCVHAEFNALLPFRIVGIGQGYEVLDYEFSHPFVSNLG